MGVLLARSFLLVLLTVDWAADPHFGRYLFSRPLASTDVSLTTLGTDQLVNRSVAENRFDTSVPDGNAHHSPPTAFSPIPLEDHRARISRDGKSLYVLMSLQC
jgi:hypothetical protein